MARSKKGGVHTQKVSAALGIMAFLLMGAFVCIVVADSSDAVSVNVEPETDFCGVDKTVKYRVTADGTYYYIASFLDSDGNSTGSISPSKGSIGSTGKVTITVTAPSTSGDCMFNIKFYESKDTTDVLLAEKNVPLKVVDPITLKFTLKNDGSTDVTISTYFKINGEKVEDSESSVTISANSTKDVTYDYIVRDVTDTTYSLESDNEISGKAITGLGVEKRYYSSDNDYGVLTTIVVVTLVILLIVLFFIYRKPVVNKGKPKGRR